MNNLLGKLRKKRDSNATENGYLNHELHGQQQHGRHRDSVDHVIIPHAAANFKSDLGSGLEDDGVPVRKHSQLAYSLDRLLTDSSALSYFIQFLEASEKLNLIKFWMHVEGFKASVNEENQAAQELSLLDAKNIYEKYIDNESTSSIAVPKRVKAIVEDRLAEKPLKASCFDAAQRFVHQLFELRYFEEFQASVYFKKHELSVLSNGCSIQDVLKVQSLLQSFLEVIKSKEHHDMVQFLLGCESFQANCGSMNDVDALSDAMSLYDKYFSMQAPNLIDLGPTLRAELESLICDESGRPHRKSFATARAACFSRLHDMYMVEFLRSPAYFGHLSELSAQIENTVELPRAHGRRRAARGSGSDAPSSTDSLTSVFNRHIEQLEQQKLDVDLTPVNSPRSQRGTPRSSRLAEVDELGRYHALYDDSHSYSAVSKTPSRLKSTLRKYLDKSALREEEIAEEVARTIILDMRNMVASGDR